ncbi:MAG TPA: DNA/RNA non-specific endonuclease [Pyrinomonadaceae bacterium]|jgi:endonuclease G|nr:DNA/RNA non-specific endonuclease [Pyrinomonadaceae bacterium]
MCPSGDRTKTPEANIETFVMSNMQPQTIRLNRGRWKNLEDFERKLAEQGDELYIYAGCFGGTRRTRQKVIVPKRCWKIILILPKGSNDLDRVTAATNVIAVSMPNTTTSSTDWTQFTSTVKAIETATGFDFFSKLPNKIEKAIETKPSSKKEVLRSP